MDYRKLLNGTVSALFVLALLVTGCSTGTNSGLGTLQVLMHDAPIDSADAVNVFIERVEVNNTDNPEQGWQVISEPADSFDLLDLTNGAYTVLGEAELEAGMYPQIRLVLSQDGHSVVVDGTVYDMEVPGQAQTGIKLNVNAEIESDYTYTLLLDFDAARSVVRAGNEKVRPKFLLKPVIRATNQAITGNISGSVSPAEAASTVYAIADSDTLASTVTDTVDGAFKLIGLEEGSYTVSVHPSADTLNVTDVNDVSVSVGETTHMGTVDVAQN